MSACPPEQSDDSDQLSSGIRHAAPVGQAPGAPVVLAGLGQGLGTENKRVERTWIIEHDDPDPGRTIEGVISPYAEDRSAIPESESGWLVMLSYELGAKLEPKAVHRHGSASGFPLAVIQRWRTNRAQPAEPTSYQVGELTSSMGKDGYIAAVERTQAFIRAGDIYQANIAHHLECAFSGCARSCFDVLCATAQPRYGSMMVFEHRGQRHAIASISPELFLECDLNTRRIRTEPMKGTRPIASDEAELRDSPKDRAELDMITDLMRNDLGRLCEMGTVRVAEPRKIEAHHSGVLQASSVVEGRLGEGVGIGDILRATFPPGSVTGAPKVRAMQIIDELEARPRNSYCGSMLSLDDHGHLTSAVSIRTAHIWGEPDPDNPTGMLDGRLVYPVGAGVVADSDPASEWAETLVKARVLEAALGLRLDL
tara:strand:- start:10024 stop:11298 length:1275 start_codon:yes stop_codon:yes gene_type:complete